MLIDRDKAIAIAAKHSRFMNKPDHTDSGKMIARELAAAGVTGNELAAKLRSFAIALDVGTTDKQIMVMGSWITAEELFAASALIAAMEV